jgi:hypothetical protein
MRQSKVFSNMCVVIFSFISIGTEAALVDLGAGAHAGRGERLATALGR